MLGKEDCLFSGELYSVYKPTQHVICLLVNFMQPISFEGCIAETLKIQSYVSFRPCPGNYTVSSQCDAWKHHEHGLLLICPRQNTSSQPWKRSQPLLRCEARHPKFRVTRGMSDITIVQTRNSSREFRVGKRPGDIPIPLIGHAWRYHDI